MAAADGDAIRADELRFMDKPRNVYFEVRRLGALGEEPPVPDVELGPVPAAGVKIALLTRCGDAALEECRDAHRRAFAPLALGAAGWEHWSTHAVGDVTPPVDAVTFACFEADRFDELRVRAFQPDRFDCQRLIVTECRSDCASGAAL
jgi:hypothetical protein